MQQQRDGAVSQASEPSDDSLSIGINLFLSFSFSFPVVDGIAGIYSATWAPHCYRMVAERLRERIGTRDDIVKRVRSFGSHVLPNPSASIELRVRRRERKRDGTTILSLGEISFARKYIAFYRRETTPLRDRAN